MQNSNTICVQKMNGYGFQKLYESSGWTIASSACEQKECIQTVDRHLCTDEAFILLQGECVLFTMGNGNMPEQAEAITMQPGSIYIVPQNVWHAHIMGLDTKLLIIENSGTADSNSQKVTLSQSLIKKLELLFVKLLYSGAERG